MTETEAQSIEFKSPIAKWNDAIFLGSFFFFIFITIGLLGVRLSYLYPFLLVCLGFATYYIARYLTMAFTTITISDSEFTISQNSRFLDKLITIKIPITNIRGFEINEVTRGFTALFIYTNSSNYYKFSLSRVKDQIALKEYLATHIKLLDKTTNPLFKSFGSAYWFALKRTFVFIILSSVTIATLYFLNEKFHFVLNKPWYLASFPFLICVLFWWYIIRTPVKKHYFRFGAFYWGSNFLFYTSIILFFPVLLNITKVKESPLTINRPFQLLSYERTGLYLIDQVSYQPDSIQLSNYIVGSKGNRSNVYPIYHQFATPLGSGDTIKKNGIYNLWLVKTYTQKSKKVPDFYEKIVSFHQQHAAVFSYSFKQKPVFYKLVEDDDLNRLVKSSYNASSQSNVLLEPYWESLAAYKNEIQQKIMVLILVFIVMNLFGCIFIAVNR